MSSSSSERRGSASGATEAEHSAGWRPIDSAPKDGNAFIAWGPVYGYHCVFFEEREPDGSGIRDAGGKLYGSEQWCWGITDGASLHRDCFTHWMPLPDPPNATPTRRWNSTKQQWEHPKITHIDGDATNKDPANLLMIWPAEVVEHEA